MDDSQQHPSYQGRGPLSTILLKIAEIYYFTLDESTLTDGPIVVVTLTDFI